MSAPTRAAPSYPTLGHVFFQAVEQFDREQLLQWHAGGRLRTYSTAEFRAAVMALCRYFQQSGMEPGERVAVLSANRPEWHIVDFAILLSGLVSVPLYTTFSPAQMRHILEHSGARTLFVANSELRAKAGGAVRHAISFEEAGCELLEDILRKHKPDPEWEHSVRAQALARDPDTLATLVYTSGTTGVPKGVMLTHGNIASNLAECVRRLGYPSVPQALSVLPLAHVFERLLCYGYFCMGVPIAYGDPHDLADLFPRHRPVVMGCVPRIPEKIRENVFEQIRAQRASRRAIARGLLKIGHAHIGEPVFGRRPTLSSRVLYGLADALLYRKMHHKLGGNLQYLICGGAKLSQEVEEFFLAAGILVVQGYGLTETAPVISLAPYDAPKPGTAGKPLDNLQIKFDRDGEILVKGPSVFKGYFKQPELTREVFEGEWFRTGDLGRLDEDGYLVITGRKKEMLVTSGGKNVHPGPIEDRLRECRWIRQALVVGDGRKFAAALLVPEMEELQRLAAANGIDCEPAHLLEDARVHAVCLSEIAQAQEMFSTHEQVKNFRFIDAGVLADPELVTPTQKLRRKVFEKKYADVIERLYEDSLKHAWQ